MKLLNTTMRNILIFAALIILAVTMIWLVRGQAQTPSVAQSPSDTPTPPFQTLTPTPGPPPTMTPTEPPLPTRTPTPIWTRPPNSVASTPRPGLTYTPTPFIPTATPEPPAVTVVSDEPLLSPEVMALVSPGKYRTVWVEAWPSFDELILRGRNLPDHAVLRMSQKQTGAPAEKRFSLLSKEQVQIEQISAPEISMNTFSVGGAAPTVLEQIRPLIPGEPVDYGNLSPDGKWVAWGYRQSIDYETLYLKRLKGVSSPIQLLGQYERYFGSVWSPDSSKIAYQVEIGLLTYEIRISDLQGRLIGTISPVGIASYLTWSPDGRYLAFHMTEERQSGINHIYLTRTDGSGLTQLTDHGFAEGPIQWSPSSDALTYSYEPKNGDAIPWLVTITQ